MSFTFDPLYVEVYNLCDSFERNTRTLACPPWLAWSLWWGCLLSGLKVSLTLPSRPRRGLKMSLTLLFRPTTGLRTSIRETRDSFYLFGVKISILSFFIPPVLSPSWSEPVKESASWTTTGWRLLGVNYPFNSLIFSIKCLDLSIYSYKQSIILFYSWKSNFLSFFSLSSSSVKLATRLSLSANYPCSNSISFC